MQDQTHIRTTLDASKALDRSSTVIDRQGNCGALTAAYEPASANNKGNAAVLATDKSTSNTAPADDSEDPPLQEHIERSYKFD